MNSECGAGAKRKYKSEEQNKWGRKKVRRSGVDRLPSSTGEIKKDKTKVPIQKEETITEKVAKAAA